MILNLDDEKFSSFKESKKAYLVPLGSFFLISILEAEICKFNSAVCLKFFLHTVLRETLSFDSAIHECYICVQNAFLKESLYFCWGSPRRSFSVFNLIILV